ncbi:MAG: 50S ribosomal protein L22 [Candidatus Curtissbacteria bacterium]|nr:50S ribosomal protein L22 [Candidatus Curtissbacteria bacterium]
MEVIATAKNIRISPQKVSIVTDQIKKVKPADGIAVLDFVDKSAAKPVKKVIASAIANAKNNFNLDEGTLSFKSIIVTKGPVFKRYRAVSRGRAHPILKRTSHIRIVLEGQPKAKSEPKEKVIEGGENGTKS